MAISRVWPNSDRILTWCMTWRKLRIFINSIFFYKNIIIQITPIHTSCRGFGMTGHRRRRGFESSEFTIYIFLINWVHVRKKTKRNNSIPYSGLEEKEENRETWVGEIKDFSIIFAIRVEDEKKRENLHFLVTVGERDFHVN